MFRAFRSGLEWHGASPRYRDKYKRSLFFYNQCLQLAIFFAIIDISSRASVGTIEVIMSYVNTLSDNSTKRYRVYVDKEFLHAFDDEYTALQYMDEQALAAQADADKLEEHFLFSVIDDGVVIASHPIHPAETKAVEFVRKVFDRGTIAPRPRLELGNSDLSLRAQLDAANPRRKMMRGRKA